MSDAEQVEPLADADVETAPVAEVQAEAEIEDPFVGTQVNDEYRIDALLGGDASGSVYRGTRLSDNAPVNITLIRPPPGASQGASDRFLREAKLLRKIDHPNIVKLLASGETEAGLYFLATEPLEGQTLGEVVPPDQGLPLEQACSIIMQICSGIDSAHQIGLVHRDIKPSTILLTRAPDGSIAPKLVGFGFARALREGKSDFFSTGRVGGTPGFIAPEEILASAQPSAATDIYALGATFYYCLSGRPPYPGRSADQVIQAQLSAPPQLIDFEAAGKPAALRPIILKAMHLVPERRYPAASVLAAALSAVMRGDPQSVQQYIDPELERAGKSSKVQKLLVPVGFLLLVITFGLFVALTPDVPAPTETPHAEGGAIVETGVVAEGEKGASDKPAPAAADAGSAGLGVGDELPTPAGGVAADVVALRVGDVGDEARAGIRAYFAQVNAAGGIHNRKIKLLGDASGDALAAFGSGEALGPRVLVGDSAAAGNGKDAFTVRAAWEDEARGLMGQLKSRKVKPAKVVVYAPNTDLGNAQMAAISAELKKRGRKNLTRLLRATDEDLDKAVQAMVKAKRSVQAVVVGGTAEGAAAFIKALRDKLPKTHFAGFSSIDSAALVKQFPEKAGDYLQNVFLATPVPAPSAKQKGWAKYREAMGKVSPDAPLTPLSAEGYIAAAVVGEALRRAGPELSAERLQTTLQGLGKVDLGLGTDLRFNATSGRGTKKVWGVSFNKKLATKNFEL